MPDSPVEKPATPETSRKGKAIEHMSRLATHRLPGWTFLETSNAAPSPKPSDIQDENKGDSGVW